MVMYGTRGPQEETLLALLQYWPLEYSLTNLEIEAILNVLLWGKVAKKITAYRLEFSQSSRSFTIIKVGN